MDYEIFFKEIGFDFKNDLKPRLVLFEEYKDLTKKLEGSVFYYKPPNNTNTSFYLITTNLASDELLKFRKYTWNKNDADLIFYYSKEKVEMLYAKFPPTFSNRESTLQEFSTSSKENQLIENIKRWQFDSGSFWLNYRESLVKLKYKGIDKELVATLKTLKDQLSEIILNLIADVKEANSVVQALIDRTLYIKYLEDNHIINSYFYSHYFHDNTLNYKKLLEGNAKSEINELYQRIHEIFNNSLFHTPEIDERYLTTEVCKLIANSFEANLESKQLRLFDFKFDVLPIEFISYIYEVFLSDKQKENGIYYTPRKLAQLIVDDVINENEIGPLLDPSCGSGMFLITGYQRLLEIAQKQDLEPEDSIDKIKFRIKLLSENIFGIEKEETAQRFAFFSLSLQVFKEINSQEIKEFIAKQLKENKKIDLFSEHSFFENIQHANTLDVNNRRFEGKVFSYILGNPPFFEIKNTEEFETEIMYLNSEVSISEDKTKSVKDIVGRHQISQCFFIKIKDWSDENTRFGFVSNSSSFYNDHSKTFQNYYYSQYTIEKLYELSRVKKILFEKAKESVVALIFSNNLNNENKIDYYPVDLGVFSEKPFELLIIQEDKIIEINQSELLKGELRLRDYLVGNEFDRNLTVDLGSKSFMSTYAELISRGFEIWGEDARKKEYGISNENWKELEADIKKEYLNQFIKKYFRDEPIDDYDKAYIKPANLKPFVKKPSTQFISNIENFHRPRVDRSIYFDDKLMLTRIGNNLNCVYSQDEDYFDFSIYIIKLRKEYRQFYYLFQAVLNSNVVRYYLDLYLRKRVLDSFPRIGIDDISNIPIPIEFDNFLVEKITQLSKELSNGNIEYSEVEEELNELVYDLYELSYWERQRVKDYFLEKKNISRKVNPLEAYKNTIQEFLSFYIETPIVIEQSSSSFNLIVVKISFDRSSKNPSSNKTLMYMLNEIFEQDPNANFMLSQEKVFGKDCAYIIKEATNINWTETKAYEDGQDILNRLIPNENE